MINSYPIFQQWSATDSDNTTSKKQEQEEYTLYFDDKFAKGLINIIYNDNIPNTLNPCATCSNHPNNGGSGICHCILGLPKITC